METLTTEKQAATWNVDPAHSTIGFAVKHMVISEAKGSFNHYTLSASSPNEDFNNAGIELEIKTDSINTGVADRDKHLASPDFFDAGQFPFIRFKSKTVTKENNEHYKIAGELTMKGVTKPLTLDAILGGVITDPWGNKRAGFEVKGEINREDFGLTWNQVLEAGGLMVGKTVKLSANIELVKNPTSFQ